jgi:hypothetical protein
VTDRDPLPRAETLSDRLLALCPLLFGFLVIAGLYVWQASRHPTPWLFSDEIEYAQISRAISETGVPARRGVEYWGTGLFPWLIAPFWWIDNLQTAYSAVKTFNVLVMTAAIFPTYALARTVMARPYALLAAVGTVVAPVFIYSAMVMQEPVAYFTATLAFYLTARVLAAPTRWTVVAAVVVGFVAPFVRDQLIVVPALMIAAVGTQYVCFGGGREYLKRASRGRRVVIAIAAAVTLGLAIAVARSGSGQIAVAFRSPGTMLDQAMWAWGALTVGVGVLPVVIGLGMLAPSTAIEHTRSLKAFASVFATSVVIITAYVAVKGSYEAATFEPRISERNLAYLTPLLFLGLALFTSARAIRPWTLAVAAAFTAWAIASVPIHFGGLEGDAPGLAILSRFREDYGLGSTGAHQLLYGLIALSVLVGLVPVLLSQRRLAAWIVVGAALLSMGWSVRAETVASRYSNDFSKLFFISLPKPLGWVDDATSGQRALYLGQKIADPNGIWSMEFWNRNVRKVWDLDGTAPGPGPRHTPNLASTDGRLADDPGYAYVVADNGVTIAGTTVAEKGQLRLVRIDPPLRLKDSVVGVFNDGWIGSTKPADTVSGGYNDFAAPKRPGTVLVRVSRKGFCGPKAPGKVLIEVGTLGLGQQRDGVMARVTQRRGWVVDSCADRTFPIPTPGGPFRVNVTVTPPFQPSALDPRLSERRYLGAQVEFSFKPA